MPRRSEVAPGKIRLQLLVGYDGRPFSGWQSQPDKNGVQDFLEKALAELCGEKIIVHGSGRTDAGVHAIAQSAHVDVPQGKLTIFRWGLALNACLPPAIRVKTVRPVAGTFHARFSACSKVYRYRIFNENWLDPLEVGRAWQVPGELDFAAMEAALKILTGEHDFRAFSANRGHAETSTIRNIRKISLRREGPVITLTFQGNGFLYKMVRMLAGTIIQAGRGKIRAADIRRHLTDFSLPKTSHAAPAAGLYLVRVGYRS